MNKTVIYMISAAAACVFLCSSCNVTFETRVKNGLIERLAGCYNNSLLLLNYMQADIQNKLESDRMDREKYRLLLTETEAKRANMDFGIASPELKHELDQRISRYKDYLETLDNRMIENEKKLYKVEIDLARFQALDLVSNLDKASENWTVIAFSNAVYLIRGYGLGFNSDRLMIGEWKYYNFSNGTGYVSAGVVSQQLLERLHLRYAYGPDSLVAKNYQAFSDLQGERSSQQPITVPSQPVYYIPGQ